MHGVLVFLGVTAATWSAIGVYTGRVKVFVNPDPEVAIYRDAEPRAFWSIIAFLALLALVAFYFAGH